MSVELCTICLESLDDNDINLFFCSQCNNKYHKNCIFEMVKFNRSQGKTSKCPICREEIYLFAMILLYKTQDEIIRDGNTHMNMANERTPLISTRCRHITCRFLLCFSGRCFFN